MTHTSQLFGAFEYSENQVITFQRGLLGFHDCTRFVIKSHVKTAPIKWLLSVEEGGPEFAIVDPSILDSRCAMASFRIGRETLRKIGARRQEDVKVFVVVTIPKDFREISMNLRAPLLICPEAKLGLQRQEPDIRSSTVRRPIYRELTGDVTEKTNGQLVLLRKINETIKIGEDIEIEVIALEDGGVRLGVSAPKNIRISRGRNNFSAEHQMRESAKHMDVSVLMQALYENKSMHAAAV